MNQPVWVASMKFWYFLDITCSNLREMRINKEEEIPFSFIGRLDISKVCVKHVIVLYPYSYSRCHHDSYDSIESRNFQKKIVRNILHAMHWNNCWAYKSEYRSNKRHFAKLRICWVWKLLHSFILNILTSLFCKYRNW